MGYCGGSFWDLMGILMDNWVVVYLPPETYESQMG